ncbi:hypothetical protein Ndes2526B_g01988 [Nannochloris sp. 'desiccata']
MSGSARIAVSSPFRTATENSRAAALATGSVTSVLKAKFIDEQELEEEYKKLLLSTHKISPMEQLAKWVKLNTISAAVVFIYIGFQIFRRNGLGELAGYAALLCLFTNAVKYVINSFSETISVLNQIPVALARGQSSMKRQVDQQKTEILEHVDQQKTEILEHVDQQKTEILEHVDRQKTEILEHVDQQKTEILAAIKESKS